MMKLLTVIASALPLLAYTPEPEQGSHAPSEASGWTQVEGGPVEAIHAGDVVWCPPDVRHWHGATPTSSMAHIAVQEAENGSPVEWMEHVPDDHYAKGPQ